MTSEERLEALTKFLVRDKARTVYLFDEINEVTSATLIESLNELDTDKRKRPITLYLSSPGGYCSYGFAVVDAIERLKCPIKVIGTGEIASMAPLIYVACDERMVTPHTFFMFHPISTGGEDYLKFLKARFKNAEEIEAMYDRYLISKTNIPRSVYTKAKSSEVYINAQDAIKYGIAHKIA